MMKEIISELNLAEFRAKKHWWMWAICLLWHVIAVRLCMVGRTTYNNITPGGNIWLLIVVLICDIIILPDASHFKYVFDDKFLEIKCVLFPGHDILLNSITAVENATLMTFRGAGVKFYEQSFGAYKISYMDGGRRKKAIVVAPKDRDGFIKELSMRVDKNVILIDNAESAFKKKKDII